MPLTVRRAPNEKPGFTTYEFEGRLDERSQHLEEMPVDWGTVLHLRLQKLTLINSTGLRTFIRWVKATNPKQMILSECQPPFVDQLNLIFDIIPPGSIVESFYVPYVNEETDESRIVLFRRLSEYRRDGENVKLTKPVVLDTSGKPMEIDIFEDKYFRFLKKFG